MEARKEKRESIEPDPDMLPPSRPPAGARTPTDQLTEVQSARLARLSPEERRIWRAYEEALVTEPPPSPFYRYLVRRLASDPESVSPSGPDMEKEANALKQRVHRIHNKMRAVPIEDIRVVRTWSLLRRLTTLWPDPLAVRALAMDSAGWTEDEIRQTLGRRFSAGTLHEDAARWVQERAEQDDLDLDLDTVEAWKERAQDAREVRRAFEQLSEPQQWLLIMRALGHDQTALGVLMTDPAAMAPLPPLSAGDEVASGLAVPLWGAELDERDALWRRSERVRSKLGKGLKDWELRTVPPAQNARALQLDVKLHSPIVVDVVDDILIRIVAVRIAEDAVTADLARQAGLGPGFSVSAGQALPGLPTWEKGAPAAVPSEDETENAYQARCAVERRILTVGLWLTRRSTALDERQWIEDGLPEGDRQIVKRKAGGRSWEQIRAGLRDLHWPTKTLANEALGRRWEDLTAYVNYLITRIDAWFDKGTGKPA